MASGVIVFDVLILTAVLPMFFALKNFKNFQISVISPFQPKNLTIDAIGYMPADPLLPDGTLVGTLVGSKPLNGCAEVEGPPLMADPIFNSEAIVLLAQRGSCNISWKVFSTAVISTTVISIYSSFVSVFFYTANSSAKYEVGSHRGKNVQKAQSAGYDALIIFDNLVDGNLLEKTTTEFGSNETLPVFYVSYLDGRLLWRRFQYFTESYVVINMRDNSSVTFASSRASNLDNHTDITNALLGFIPTVSYVCVVALIILIFITRRFLHCSLFVVYKMVTGNSKMAPFFKAKVTDSTIQIVDNAPCCICLENFKADDQIHAILPCKHIFHQNCIDRWLKSGKLACPLCRRKITLRKIIQQVFWTHLSFPR